MNAAGGALLDVILWILQGIWWIVIIAALVSWVNPDPRNPIVRFLWGVTEPMFRPFRRLVPPSADGRHRHLAALRARHHLSAEEFPRSHRHGQLTRRFRCVHGCPRSRFRSTSFRASGRGSTRVEVQQFLARRRRGHGRASPARTRSSTARLRALEQENEEHRERERILKQTLLSAQRASEDIRKTAHKEAELIVREAQDSAERLTHSALQRAAEIEKAIHELKIQRTNFRLQLQKMLELFQQVLEFDREEDEKERPLSYMTRKPKEESWPARSLAALAVRLADPCNSDRRCLHWPPRTRSERML